MNQDSFENLYSQFVYAARQAQQNAQNARSSAAQDYLNQLNGWKANGTQLGGNPRFGGFRGFTKDGRAPNWGSVEEMLADLNKLPKTPKAKPIDKATRIQEIETELDIIRGRVPTPKGYKVDASKVKSLMIELRELKHGG